MIKAINATTVEVTFADDVEDVKALDFAIKGLDVTNAVVKQTNKKTVVLTTSAQTAGVEYTVTVNGNEVGKFTGLSAVVPTKVELVSSSVQGKLGQQVTVQAKVTVPEGQSKAGIPVTFNVPGNNNDAVNPTITGEANTDENGVATYTYTRYAAQTDAVTAYATGDRSKFAVGYVFWGVDTILSVEEVTKGDTINNGANKTYKVKYLDPKTGKPVSGKRFNVSFVENINVNVNQLSDAKVNNVNPTQLLNNTAPVTAVIVTDAKGEATFTVTGENTEVTPVIFEQVLVSNTANQTVYSSKYEASLLQTSAAKVKFSAVQASYTIELTRDGGEEAAVGVANGREYKVVVKDKDGNVAKNETVNIALNEDLDGVIGTNTSAKFIKEDANDNPYYAGDKITVVTNAKGEATFVIGSEKVNDYATPIAWIDVNSANAIEGKLDKGEASIIGDISYFAKVKLTGATLTTFNAKGTKTKEIDASEPATFKVALSNQSGKPISLVDAGYNHIEASFTVYNTGANAVEVNGQVVSPNRSYTVPASSSDAITVKSVDGKSTSVKVIANGVAKSNSANVLDYNFTSSETTATFTASTEVPALYTGVVVSYDSGAKTIKFDGKNPVKYTGTGFKYYGGNGAQLANADAFITELTKAGTAVVTRSVDADGVATFSIVSLATGPAGKPVDTKPGPVVPHTGVLTLTPAAGGTVDLTAASNTLTVNLADADLNLSSTAIDTATVSLKDSATGALTLTLVETGTNTGEFVTTVQAGTLAQFAAGTLTVTYADAKNASGVAQDIKASVTLKKSAGSLSVGTFTQAVAAAPAKAAEYTTKSIDAGYTFGTETFSLDIDGAGAQTINLSGKTGAQGVADAINAAFTGSATVSGDRVVIKGTATASPGAIVIASSTVTQVPNASLVFTGVVNASPATQAFTINSPLAVGEKVVIDGVEYTAVAFGTTPTATTFVVESAAGTLDTAANQAGNLATAITTNTADKFDAAVSTATITLTSTEAPTGTTITAPVITLK